MQCGATPVDVSVQNEGSVIAFWPHSENARQWFDENVQSESWQWLGSRLVVDWRYAADLIHGLQQEGFNVVEG